MLLTALAMLGFVVHLHRRFAWPVETIPLPLAAGAITALYAAGLAGHLAAGMYVIVGGGLALGLIELRRGGLTAAASDLATPALLTFALVVILLVWRLHAAVFIGWDEFSHWGLTSKLIVDTDALIGRESAVLLKDYPPGSALFHYLVMWGTGFSEAGSYIAHAVLALSAITALLAGARWPTVLTTMVFGYLGLFTLGRGLQTLDVDHIVALFFGCSLGSYFLSRDPGRALRVVPVLFALPLLKSVGMLLSIFVAGCVITDRLLGRRLSRRDVVVMILLALAPVVASRSWKHHSESIGAATTFPLSLSTARIADSFSNDRATPRDRLTIERFREALGALPISAARTNGPFRQAARRFVGMTGEAPGLSARSWTILLVVLAAAVIVIQPTRRDRWRLLPATAWLVACGICYTFGLLLLYLYSFTEYEGVRLASFGRYLGIFFFGVAIIMFAWAANGLSGTGWRRKASGLVLGGLTLVFFYAAPGESLRFAIMGPHGISGMRATVKEAVAPVVARAAPEDRIYLVWQATNGFEHFMGRFEVAPRIANRSCWSLGTPRYDGDVWTCSIPPDRWAEVLREYDFVVLGRVDDTFWTEFGELFPRHRSEGVYRVEKMGPKNTTQLIPFEDLR
jgi:hypothetical protein